MNQRGVWHGPFVGLGEVELHPCTYRQGMYLNLGWVISGWSLTASLGILGESERSVYGVGMYELRGSVEKIHYLSWEVAQ